MLNENLRNLRKAHNMTQQNMADVLGLERSAYTCYETGKTNPSVDSMKKICDIFNISMGYLCGVEENRPELRKAKAQVLSSPEIDPIAGLSKEERFLLMYFRVLEAENKEKVVEYIRNLDKLDK